MTSLAILRDLRKSHLPLHAFAISSDREIRNEVNESLRKRSASIKSSYRRIKGKKRSELDEKKWKFHIFEGQVESVKELQERNRYLKDEIEEWKKRYTNLMFSYCTEICAKK